MLTFDIRSNFNDVQRKLTELQKERLPRAQIVAANRIGREIVLALQAEMDRVFDRPTPWAKRGVRQLLATKSNPVFEIWIEEFGGKGIPQAKFLAAEIEGGPRRHKRFERALILKGLMPSNCFAVPGRQAPLDAYGNVPGSFIVRMLSDLQAFGEVGYRANRVGKRKGWRKTNYFFVPKPGSHLKPGVYWHMPHGMLGVVFTFVPSFSYTARFDFEGVGRQAFHRHAARIVAEEFNRL